LVTKIDEHEISHEGISGWLTQLLKRVHFLWYWILIHIVLLMD